MRSQVYLVAAESFPRAQRYIGRSADTRLLREHPRRPGFLHSERHLQCVWYDPSLRPGGLITGNGEAVEILNPGVWNLEAGPDFLDAAILVGASRRIAGDAEVHIHPSHWAAHKHTDDPRYRNVRIHVTYYAECSSVDHQPPGSIHIPLAKPLSLDPLFDFESIDVTAFPHASVSRCPPCGDTIRTWSRREKTGLLDAAGEERLLRKSERMAWEISEKGEEQVLYEQIMSALGFKNNKGTMHLLARRLPVHTLRAACRGHAEIAYALLLGISGLLPSDIDSRWDSETSSFVRRLWRTWMKKSGQLNAGPLPKNAWNFSGLRPANHPMRRLMAAACLFATDGPLSRRFLHIVERHPSDAPAMICSQIESVSDDFWTNRWSLGGKETEKTISLIGRPRAAAITTNVIIPFVAATGGTPRFAKGLLDALPSEESNSVVKQTAYALFGRDHSSSLYRGALRKQGLMQIFHDFCLRSRTDCANCRLPCLL
ncbi:MAG: DUF2851 family protein [Verrucomicrobia bacterium]|nr:DUF2851 family protein [Verrucomicrobiota bacterium]